MRICPLFPFLIFKPSIATSLRFRSPYQSIPNRHTDRDSHFVADTPCSVFFLLDKKYTIWYNIITIILKEFSK